MALKVNFAHQISHKTKKIRSIFFYFLLDFDMKFKIKLSKNQKWPKHMFMKIKNPSVQWSDLNEMLCEAISAGCIVKYTLLVSKASGLI